MPREAPVTIAVASLKIEPGHREVPFGQGWWSGGAGGKLAFELGEALVRRRGGGRYFLGGEATGDVLGAVTGGGGR
jgi:hypothetical protein